MAIAPAMTLKRMYHCVPSSISTIAAAVERDAGHAEDGDAQREEHRRGERGDDLDDRLGDAREPRRKADRETGGQRPERAERGRGQHARERQRMPAEQRSTPGSRRELGKSRNRSCQAP